MKLNKLSFVIIVLTIVILLPLDALPKTYAWLTDAEKKAYKLDVAANKILQPIIVNQGLTPSAIIEDSEGKEVADSNSNLLLIVYDYPGRFMGQGVKVFNLKNLSFKKDLGLTSYDPNFELPKLIVPPIGNKFYVIWWDRAKAVKGVGGETYSVYDKGTLTEISKMANFPIDLSKPWKFSSDGKSIYSINIDANEIKVYDSINLTFKETISIANIWGAPLYGRNASYYTNDKILFAENIKNNETEPNNVRYFVYTIPTKQLTPKISVGDGGNDMLSPDGSKIVINDINYIYQSPGVISEIKRLNRIRIYDVITGQKAKTLDLTNKYRNLDISGMSPDSTKLYLVAVNIQTGATTTIVVDLKSYSIIAEIPVEASLTFFFNE